MGDRPLPRQGFEGLLDAFAHAYVGRQGLEGGGGFFFAVAQRQQSLLDVGVRIAGWRGRAGSGKVGREFALEFQKQAGSIACDLRVTTR